MAGNTLQNTAAAPATGAGAPSESATPNAAGVQKTTTKSSNGDGLKAAASKEAGNAGDPGASGKSAAAATKKAPKEKSGAPAPTYERTQIEFENELRRFNEEDVSSDQTGNAKDKESVRAAQRSGQEHKAKERDEIQDEIDAAAKAAGLEIAEGEKAEDAGNAGAPGKNAQATKDAEDDTAEAPTNADEFAKWINTLSKPAARKITAQQERIKELNAAAAERIQIEPTLKSPLAHVSSLEQLKSESDYWKDVRDRINNLEKTGTLTVTDGEGRKQTFDPDEPEDAKVIENYRNWAWAALDAVPDAQERIQARAEAKPWEAAMKLVPDIFDKESRGFKAALEVIRANPEFKLAFPDYEVRLAHMVRSMQMEEDQKPTADRPKGRAQWVRLELDKDGNVILPKRAGGAPGVKSAAESAGQRKPTAPSSAAAAVRQAGTRPEAGEAINRAEKSRTDDDFRAAVAAEFGGRRVA